MSRKLLVAIIFSGLLILTGCANPGIVYVHDVPPIAVNVASGTVTATVPNPLPVSGTVTAVVPNPLPVSGTVTATVPNPLPVSGTVTATVPNPLPVSGTVTATVPNPLPVSGSVTTSGTATVSGSISITGVTPTETGIIAIPYYYAIADGNISGHTAWSKIGFNGTVTTAEADIWSATGAYVFPLVADGWQVISSSAGNEDKGTSIFNGTSSGGTTISLIDAAKNFNGGTAVQVGDCVILDKAMDGGRTPEFGYVSAITSNTELAIANGFSSGGSGTGRVYYVIDQSTAANTGVQVVKIEYLDGSYVTKNEIVIMNGNTAVNTINVDMFRVNSFRAIAVGSGGKSVGTISLRLEGGAATVYTSITIGYTRARNIIYTVPLGKTLFLTSGTFGYAYSHNSTHYARIYIKANVEPSIVFNTGNIFYPLAEFILSNSTVVREFEIPLRFPAKADIRVSILAEYAGIADCALRGWLE